MEIPSNWSIHRSTHVPHSATKTQALAPWPWSKCAERSSSVQRRARPYPCKSVWNLLLWPVAPHPKPPPAVLCSRVQWPMMTHTQPHLWWTKHPPKKTHTLDKHTLPNTQNQGMCFSSYDVSFPRSLKEFFFEITSNCFPQESTFIIGVGFTAVLKLWLWEQ